ncbi:hypothetical protein IQ266_12590, partial [filamentous cyanobacterium LEGE 11480]
MNHYCEQWIADWCQEHGWTDWFPEQRSYWAFPPHAVMPTPIPQQALRNIKADNGFSPDERAWGLAGLASLVSGVVMSYGLSSPMPMLMAFGFCAVVA